MYYIPELWKVISEISPRVNRVKSCLSWTRKKLENNHCDKAKEAPKELFGIRSAECEALRDNLRAAAACNAEQEQSIEALKQELADLNINAAKKVK